MQKLGILLFEFPKPYKIDYNGKGLGKIALHPLALPT